jgi:hypothetical protein
MSLYEIFLLILMKLNVICYFLLMFVLSSKWICEIINNIYSKNNINFLRCINPRLCINMCVF